MNYLTEEKFSFKSKAVDDDTFGVVFFTGEEGLSSLYQFDITLVSSDANVDMDKMLQEQASFFIHRSDGSKVPFKGVLAEFDLLRTCGQFYLYRALLVPRFWRMTLTHHNQVFLKQTPKEIISKVLEDGGLSSMDYEFRLRADYVTWDYACQYGESHYDFICRWLEDNGLYYFFDQSGETEKLIITDSSQAHIDTDFGTDLVYSPASGLESMHLDEVIQSYICRRQTTPKKITLQDYNYRKPTLDVLGKADVDSKGYGEMFYYGDHFRTPEEGNKLAKIRSEEHLCRARQFHGESTVPYLMPGYTFSLKKHFREDMNRAYLTISIEHQGNQASYLISGIRENLVGIELKSVYHNTFTTIYDDVQFRQQRLTERPKLHGTISAKIDGSRSDKYAEVDDHGRYKVLLPFDRADREGGKASAWVRMMQPYGGSGHGMNFPLHKGCEVLLTFIDGNPDRPVIAGAVANPDNPSQINSDNHTMSRVTTSGGNKIHIEDKEGEQRILHQSPTAQTWMRMGAPNDPPAAGSSDDEMKKEVKKEVKEAMEEKEKEEKGSKTKEDGFGFSTSGSADWWIGANYKVEIGGFSNNLVIGGENKVVLGEETRTVVGADAATLIGGVSEAHFPEKWTLKNFHQEVDEEKTEAHVSVTDVSVDKTVVEGEKTVLQEVEDKITAAQTKIAESFKAVYADGSQVFAHYDEIIAEQNKTIASIQEALGEKCTTVATCTETNAEKTESNLALTLTNGEKTETSAEITVTAAETTELGANKCTTVAIVEIQ